MAKELERILGKRKLDGTIEVAGLTGVRQQKALDETGPKVDRPVLRVRKEALVKGGLDIEWDHPKVKGPDGDWYQDHSKPPVPSGGEHVGFANFLALLVMTGEALIDWKVSYSKTGRKKVEESLTILRDEMMSFTWNQACFLLTNYACILEEVDTAIAPKTAPVEEDLSPKFMQRIAELEAENAALRGDAEPEATPDIDAEPTTETPAFAKKAAKKKGK